MNRRLTALLLAVMMLPVMGMAEIIPPAGVDESFEAFSGIKATRAVVLCETLSVLPERGDQNPGAQAVTTLSFGDTFLTWESWDGWCNCYYSDGAETGWVRNNYVAIDPPYYMTDQETAVYAYQDKMAPRVALLNAGEKLPILLETEDWCVVSLRGAAGWIAKTPQDTARLFWFSPALLAGITSATLAVNVDEKQPCEVTITDPDKLAALTALLTDVRDTGGVMAGCPFGRMMLTLTTQTSGLITLDLAWDSCSVYRVDGARDYRYGASLDDAQMELLTLFGVKHPLDD